MFEYFEVRNFEGDTFLFMTVTSLNKLPMKFAIFCESLSLVDLISLHIRIWNHFHTCVGDCLFFGLVKCTKNWRYQVINWKKTQEGFDGC